MSSKQLTNVEVSVDEFMGLFRKEDYYSQKILSVLNYEIRMVRKSHDEEARKILQSHMLEEKLRAKKPKLFDLT
jgi:hypothetical protein